MSSIIAAGVFEGFFSSVAGLLSILYGLTGSYGGAIILLTIIVMIVTAPLTLKSTRSMLQMQKHQPELKKLQAQYKDDREKLNTEMMAFYKDNGINPLSGCVPVLMQAPIFIILYQVLRGITTRMGGSASGIGRVAGQSVEGLPFEPYVLHEQVFEPQHLSSTNALYESLHNSTKMNFFGVDLSISPLDAWRIGLGTAIPFLLLMLFMLVSQIVQNRQIQGRNTSAQVNPQQQAIMKILPFMLPVFSFQFPAGLGLYYFVQGLCRIGLQGYITRAVYRPHHDELKNSETADSSATPTTPKNGSTKGGSPKGSGAKGSATDDGPAKNGGVKSRQTPSKETNSKSSPSKSAKSAAAQRKASGGTTPQAGRKSGDPRARKKPR